MLPRGSPSPFHSFTGARSSTRSSPRPTRMPTSAAVMLLPADQLICGVCGVHPGAYRSPMIFPRYTATIARMLWSVCAIPQSSAAFTLATSTPAGTGAVASALPIGHGSVASSGRRDATRTGLKRTSVSPRGRIEHPWSPLYVAVREAMPGPLTVTA
jgi:hypothetical protein